MSRRARYPAQTRDAAMAALYASAVFHDGELTPNFSHVSSTTGVSRPTLRKWWNGRDTSRDFHLRSTANHARQLTRERASLATVEDLVRAAELAIHHLAQASSWEDVPVHQAARALESIARSHERLVAILSDPEEDKSTSTMDRAREAVKRTGLGRLLRGEDT